MRQCKHKGNQKYPNAFLENTITSDAFKKINYQTVLAIDIEPAKIKCFRSFKSYLYRSAEKLFRNKNIPIDGLEHWIYWSFFLLALKYILCLKCGCCADVFHIIETRKPFLPQCKTCVYIIATQAIIFYPLKIDFLLLEIRKTY